MAKSDCMIASSCSPFEVYVHVPFCLKRCGYCDFNTYTATDLGWGASRENYAHLAIQEMKRLKEWQHDHGIEEPPVSTVFFGGGTPTVLPVNDLIKMLEAIRDIWGIEPGAEITTEANPDTVDRAYLQDLKEGGFTRVSFGMQSAIPHVLKVLDRTHTPTNVLSNVRAAHSVGLDCSVDLIYGTPGESVDDWRKSVQAALDLGVKHISAYALTIESKTKMGRQIVSGAIPAPNDDDEALKYELADELLSEAGLNWYEISNWAKPGFESRHNRGYWRNVDWAGIGPGAHSHYNHVNFMPDFMPQSGISQSSLWRSTGNNEDGSISASKDNGEKLLVNQSQDFLADPDLLISAPIRSWDIKHPGKWAQALEMRRIPWEGVERITAKEHLEEFIMLGLRLREGLSISELNNLSGKSFKPQNFCALTESGLVTIVENNLVATQKGRLLNDSLIESLFTFVGI